MKRGGHPKAERPLKKGKKAAPSPAQDVRIRAVRMSGDDMAHVSVPKATTVRELRERVMPFVRVFFMVFTRGGRLRNVY